MKHIILHLNNKNVYNLDQEIDVHTKSWFLLNILVLSSIDLNCHKTRVINQLELSINFSLPLSLVINDFTGVVNPF